MSDMSGQGGQIRPAGWYHAEGDPVGSQRYWDGNAWQGEPRMVADPAQPAGGAPAQYQEAPARSASDAGGFLSTLFDTQFKSFITRRAISIVYILAIVAIGLSTIAFLIGGLAAGGPQALFALIIVPLIGLLYLIWIRMILEFFVNHFRQTELLEEVAEKLTR